MLVQWSMGLLLSLKYLMSKCGDVIPLALLRYDPLMLPKIIGVPSHKPSANFMSRMWRTQLMQHPTQMFQYSGDTQLDLYMTQRGMP